MLPTPKLDDAHEFKPMLAEIEDSPVSPLGRATFWLVIAVIVFFIGWSVFGQVDIVVSAQGRVLPDGHVKVLQPLDTGVVRNILVKEGDPVRKGQVVMEIDPSSIDPELESTEKNLRYSELEMERILSTLSGRRFQPAGGAFDHAAVATQADLYVSALSDLDRQIEAKREELAKVEQEMKSAQVDRDENQTLLEVNLEKERRLNSVKDIIARDDYEKVTNDILTYRDRVVQAGHKLSELSHRKNQILHESEQLRQQFRKTNLQELAEKQKTANELLSRLKQTSFKSAKQQIISPVDGCVDRLFVHTVGGVVTPAEKLLSIVPADTPLVVKADVLNKDIGFVDKGLPVNLKVDTFDFQKYGMFEGTVKLVSQDSHEDDKSPEARKSLLYDVYIVPTTPYLIVDGRKEPLSSGMSLTAEIKVGKRRIIEFFVYPLIKYWHEGMSVR